MSDVYKKARWLLIGTFLVFAILVAPHEGEFWPFSIYPMFSQGGRTWSRAVVRDVTAVPDSLYWHEFNEDDLPGTSYPLVPAGINQNDIANFVAKSTTWNPGRVAAMRKIFGEATRDQSLMIFRVVGSLNQNRMVDVAYTPFLVMHPDTVLFNPNLTYPSDQ